MVSHRKKPRALRPDEVEFLVRFLRCDIRLDELARHFDSVLQFDFTAKVRKLDQRFLALEPAIRVETAHIDHAVALRTSGALAADELERWAAFLLLCDAYDWEGPDEENTSERLHALSMPAEA